MNKRNPKGPVGFRDAPTRVRGQVLSRHGVPPAYSAAKENKKRHVRALMTVRVDQVPDRNKPVVVDGLITYPHLVRTVHSRQDGLSSRQWRRLRTGIERSIAKGNGMSRRAWKRAGRPMQPAPVPTPPPPPPTPLYAGGQGTVRGIMEVVDAPPPPAEPAGDGS